MKNLRLLTLLLILFMVSTASGQWTRYSIGIDEIETIRSNASGSLMISVFEGRNLFLSTDEAQSWVPFATDLGADNYYPFDAQILNEEFILVSEEYNRTFHYKVSTNLGESWVPFNVSWVFDDVGISSREWTGVLFDPRNTDRVVYADGNGLAVSPDEGENWNVFMDTDNWYGSNGFWLESENTDDIYAFGNITIAQPECGLLAKTSNNGDTWQNLLTLEMLGGTWYKALDMIITNEGTIYVALADGLDHVYMVSSANGGVSWDVGGQICSDFDDFNLFTIASQPGSIFAYDGKTINKTTDWGVNWSVDRLNMPHEEFDIAVLCTEGENLFINMDSYGFFSFDDEAESWNEKNAPVVNSLSTITNHTVEMFEDGILFHSGSYTNLWKPNDQEIFIDHRFSEDPDSTIIVKKFFSRDENNLVFKGYKFPNDFSGNHSECRDYLFISNDGGQSFSKERIEIRVEDRYLLDIISRVDNEQLILETFYGFLYYEDVFHYTSFDTGRTWIRQDDIAFPMSTALFTDDGQTITTTHMFLDGWDTVEFLHFSYDGGSNWINPGIPNTEYTFDFPQGNPMFYGDEIYHIVSNELWHYQQEGTWTYHSTIHSELMGMCNPCFELFEAEYGIKFIGYFKESSEIFISDYYGLNWTVEDYGLGWVDSNNEIKGVRYDPYRDLIWFSTAQGLYSCPINALGVGDQQVSAPVDYELLEAYPNPFNPSTQIKYSIISGGAVQLRVFDILGREVQNLVDSKQVPGYYTVNFDGSNLSSGTYFINLDTPSNSRTKKITLLK